MVNLWLLAEAEKESVTLSGVEWQPLVPMGRRGEAKGSKDQNAAIQLNFTKWHEAASPSPRASVAPLLALASNHHPQQPH